MGIFSRFTQGRRKKEQIICSAVVVAAGSARRMEGLDKILACVGGIPLICHVLRELELCPQIQEIIVVTREDLLVPVSQLCRDYAFDKVTKVVTGGAERTDSVQKGLQEVSPQANLVAIQDGARPFLTQQILSDTIALAAQWGAAAPAVPVKDTIKQVSAEGIVAATLERSSLRAIQTPQIFEASVIKAALHKAKEDGAVLTDDCSAVERIGIPVHLSQGSDENIKITTPTDLELAETIWNVRENV